MIVAIDGPAGSGKSTLAKMIAEKFNLTFMNTGSFYRALALAVLRSLGGAADGSGGMPPDVSDEERWISFAEKTELFYKNGNMYLGRENVESYLRSDAVESVVARISAIVPIRRILNEKIRNEAKKIGAVCEGRDMTTVVFPNADYKFYLDASAESRAKRRFEQGTSKLSLEEIKKTIIERDEVDKNKKEGSLQIASDAFYLDTSDLTISEVYAKMLDKIHNKGLSMEKMEVVKDVENGSNKNIQAQLQEEYLNNFEAPEAGTIKEGYVVAVNNGTVFVDVGGKSEGHIPLEEFDEEPKVNDKVNVFIEKTEGFSGSLVVSKLKADRKILQKALKEAYENNTPIEGTISKLVRAGYEVKLGGGLTTFLPLSQADVVRVEKPESLLGVKSKFYIEKLSFNARTGENIVVNRRKYMEERTEKEREAFFATAKIGDTVKGTVKSFTSFGSFIDLGGFDGLLHINDMSWGHVTRPKDFVKKGEEIEVKVIRLDPENKRINLSLKHFTQDPWLNFEDKFHVDDVVTGTVTKTTDFGAFIELDEGIEGLAHISEFSWVKKISKPEDMVKPGDKVTCMILGYDIQAGRVSLGLKQVTDNPWDSIEDRYKVGTRLTRKVVKITNAGAFIQLEEGIDGFLHADDISWIKRVKHPGSELEVGQEIEVIVIECDAESRRIRLGIKQLTDDPWEQFAASYKQGSVVEGEVSSITDFGIFVKVPGNIEGLIHKQNLVENREDNPDEVLAKYKVGDKVKAVVIELNPKTKKTAFSIRDLKRRQQQEEISQYMSNEQEGEDSSYTLGDLLKNKPE
ncbi:bifunctional cytidylate kinase/30S ribosomal protein S1 [Treponema pedis]|uniref:Cytidylate kinase n=1 Tax=Treponema pedis TaxID=409322 RepID=A0A7S7AV28_9SPIR|nr:bifunctional cytidylate kinase/30S ribosomal protein S1 [Treponema pedis]QOW59720.1 bifunctional cytidylate kinase/30S ribosomal protein S1 [Treponema pedis]